MIWSLYKAQALMLELFTMLYEQVGVPPFPGELFGDLNLHLGLAFLFK